LHRSQPARACPPASTACHQESSAQVTSLQVNNAGTLGHPHGRVDGAIPAATASGATSTSALVPVCWTSPLFT
ncbi:hypothetical protein, partial [Mycobacterium marinum]|uniref:hypothetical protein n=1 Tax=Mycobacterium marinum TaxID=1781 RepID=UPI0021C48C9C